MPKGAFKKCLRLRLRLRLRTAPTAPKVIEKLPHGERVLSREHNDEMIVVSVLLISTSIIFFYFFK